MSAVVPLLGGLVPGEPQQELIDALEDMLKQAKSGELQFAAFALVDRHESPAVGWKGDCKASTSTAAIAWLHHRYMSSYSAA